MADLEELVDEIVVALNAAGEIEKWMDLRLVSCKQELLASTFRRATRRLLDSTPPNANGWEHLLVVASAASSTNRQSSYEACRSAISELTDMILEDGFSKTALEHVLTLASSLTMVLAAQRKLRQPVEIATRALYERFPEYLQAMAERCQDIWQQHGQMTGTIGLYVWDSRNNEWRLNQDFKSFRTT